MIEIDIEKICSSICIKAKHYNGCRYIENKVAAEDKLIGFLEGLEVAEIICDSFISKNHYKTISEVRLTLLDDSQVANVFIDVENRTADIVKKTGETTIIKKIKV